jgi:hypothetical protein
MTCKRRHLKCDEARPKCGQCVKSKQTCLYNYEASQSLSSPLLSESVDGYTYSEPQTSQASQASSPELTPDVDPPTDTVSSLITIADAQTCISTNTGNSYQPAPTPPDAAFYRWFGLLANDAAVPDEDIGALRIWAAASDTPDPSTPLSPLINGLSLRAFRERYAIPSAVVPCLSQTSPVESASTSPSWQGSQPAQLTDREAALFNNFVVRVSSWVSMHFLMLLHCH